MNLRLSTIMELSYINYQDTISLRLQRAKNKVAIIEIPRAMKHSSIRAA